MPSTKDPNTTVNPGPGKVPAGTVAASALLVPPGGGGGAGLEAHITDPTDAHMASAIGINPFYPPTGEPLLSSVGGVIDGESVLDFIAAVKDLLPLRPDQLGFNSVTVPNSGQPTWTSSGNGGFARGTDVIPTRYVFANGTANLLSQGILYPADRGVLALYHTTTTGDYFDSANTTLVAALWLGASPSPAGIPDAAFVEASRTGAQAAYTSSGAGIDLINLTNRLPYLENYTPYGSVYANYPDDFFRYQLATFSVTRPLAAGDAGSFLLVHWREGFAVSLAAIQPVNLTALTLVGANVYSAVPSAGNFDTGNIATINRHNTFRDTQSGTVPTGVSFTAAENGVPTTAPLSGVQHYTGAGLSWTVDVRVDDLFRNSFYLGTVASPPNLPTGFTTDYPPIRFDFSGWGGGDLDVSYFQLQPTGGSPYSITVSPQPADQAQYVNGSLTIVAPTNYTRVGSGWSQLLVLMSKPFQNVGDYADPNRIWMYNSFPQSGGSTASTTVLEPFVDEKYRYVSTYAAGVALVPLIPAGGDDFNSATVLAASGADLQVVGSRLVYPQVDYSLGIVRPVGQPNYAAVLAADPGNHIRRYVRAVNTGIARNTGKIRIRGLAQSAFASSGAFTGNEVTDHPGGAILQIKVPGGTGWLDLGRPKGDPDLTTADGRGCRTSLTVAGSDLILGFDTTVFTGNNGAGDFPLFIRISFIKGAGTSLRVDEIEWQAP